MTTQNIVEAKIRALCPHLQTLEFGCEVKMDNLVHIVYAVEENEVSACLKKPFPKNLEANDFYDFEFEIGAKEVEILGKPIQLSDVLMAIGDESIVIESSGQFGMTTPDGVFVGDYPIYNLSKPFSDQNSDVYEFLNNLLN